MLSGEPRTSRPHMPGYESMFHEATLPWSWARRVLEEARNYWLATNRADGPPHVMPVWGIWLEETFCFSTAVTSRKARNIMADARCTVTAETAAGQVIVEGIATVDSTRVRLFVEAYSRKYDWPMEVGQAEPFFSVRPHKVFGFTEAAVNPGHGATLWSFDDAAARLAALGGSDPGARAGRRRRSEPGPR